MKHSWLCPENIQKDRWETLVNYWKSKKGKIINEKNKRSCTMLKNAHSIGTKSCSLVYGLDEFIMLYSIPYGCLDEDNLVEEQLELVQNNDERVASICTYQNACIIYFHAKLDNLVEEQLELVQNNDERVA
uniref:Uncharacterized protein n=1 Tax=Oryza brachyantha TaxID=4533 RepID=J3ME73_ORYBR